MTKSSDSPISPEPSGKIHSPFCFHIEPMQRLLLINFEKDPDEVYLGLEPQWIEDPVNGTGCRMVAWRRDGYVDVYQQPGLVDTGHRFDVAGKGLADLLVRPMDNLRFQILPEGVDIRFDLEDKLGRRIEVEIRESGRKPARPFSLLAPVGSASEAPSALYLFFLYRFYFVRKAGTTVRVRIDGKDRKLDKLPLPLNGSRCYFTRYSADPFLVNLTAMNGVLAEVDPSAGSIPQGGIRYDIQDAGGRRGIASLETGNDRHAVRMSFDPPFPDLAALENEEIRDGEFCVTSEESAGQVIGSYHVEKQGERVGLTMVPDGGWIPNESNRVVRFIYRAAAVFRNWPKTYQYQADMHFPPDAPPTIRSSWTRIREKTR